MFIPGYYGPKEHFVYEWRSDHRGFKNLPSIASLEKVEVVAVGDSYTEGMGVETKDTWASRLSSKGHTTYSLGIQGYAPTQFLGAYEHYGRQLSPEWVIIGVLGNVYSRERLFMGTEDENATLWTQTDAPEAIGRLIEQDEFNKSRPIYAETREGYRYPLTITQRHRFLTSAAISLARQQWRFFLYTKVNYRIGDPTDIRVVRDEALQVSDDARLRLMARYRQEVLPASSQQRLDALLSNPQWRHMERSLSNIIRIARKDGANVLLLFFPNRGTAYYEKSTGRRLPTDAFDITQASALKSFADKQNVSFIDFLPILQREVDKLTNDSPITSYPYLKIDGHPSPVGHEIIASEIARFLETTQ